MLCKVLKGMFLSGACVFLFVSIIVSLFSLLFQALLTGQVYAAQEKGNHRLTLKAPRQLLTKA